MSENSTEKEPDNNITDGRDPFIDEQIARSIEIAARKDRMEELFVRCVNGESGSKEKEELFQMMPGCYKNWIVQYLRSVKMFTDEDLKEISQNAAVKVLELIKNKIPGKAIKDPYLYVFGIYKNAAREYARRTGYRLAHEKELPVNADGEDSNDGITDRLAGSEGPAHDDGDDAGLFGLPRWYFATGEGVIEKECREEQHKITHIYFAAAMDSDVYPPKGLALCYCHILPLLLDCTNWNVMHNVKWAVSKMGSRRIDELSDESENLINTNFDKDLKWSGAYRMRLESGPDREDEINTDEPLKGRIYTYDYDNKKIGHWSERYHAEVKKKALRKIADDEVLVEEAKKYIKAISEKTNELLKGSSAYGPSF